MLKVGSIMGGFNMNEYLMALVGGGLIGLATSLFLIFKGRVFGVSGILSGLVVPQRYDLVWKLVVVLGLIVGGWVTYQFLPEAFVIPETNWFHLAIAGMLVGFGTQLGSGCTSGHGVCGISRLSVRSIVATVVFMAAGIATVMIFH